MLLAILCICSIRFKSLLTSPSRGGSASPVELRWVAVVESASTLSLSLPCRDDVWGISNVLGGRGLDLRCSSGIASSCVRSTANIDIPAHGPIAPKKWGS